MDDVSRWLDSDHWPAWVLLWVRFAIVIGAAFLVTAIVMAVRHYCFGRPILLVDTLTRRLLTGVPLLTWLLFIGAMGTLFLVFGMLKHP